MSNDIEASSDEAQGEPTELALYNAAKEHGYAHLPDNAATGGTDGGRS